jgi:hypothetical protein
MLCGALFLASGATAAAASASVSASPSADADDPGTTTDDPDPTVVDPIVLDDGTVVTADDEIDYTFDADSSDPDFPAPPPTLPVHGQQPAYCAEVKDPPTYTVKGKPHFIADDGHPQSTWLLSRQSVTWTVTGSHTFTWDVSGGVEIEAGAIIAKAKVKIDTKISNSWTWTGTQTVNDTNSTTKAYRAVLGQVGWRLTAVKTWTVAPCKVKKKTVVVDAPRKGDMSIGRQSS